MMAREFAKEFYKSEEWQVARDYALKRDNYLCQHCNNPAEEVHHIVHLSPSNIMDASISLNPENLISLCKYCHFAEHKVDKARGIREAKRITDCDAEYEFDENGMLVRKSTPPV